MLKPIVAALMDSAGKKAKVRVCCDPLLGGVSQAMKWSRLHDIIRRYEGMIDLFLLCVDRDGEEHRREALTKLETRAKEVLPVTKYFLAENAWQELEVWVLAGHKNLPSKWSWQTIREERDPKEIYFMPYSKSRNLLNEPGEGRKTLGREAARQFDRIAQLCPEVSELQQRVEKIT